jgi:hypothetical protein
MNDEWERIWQDAVLAQFKVTSRCLPGETEENCEKPQLEQPVSQLELQARNTLMHEMRLRNIQTRSSTLSGEKRASTVK